MWLLALVWGTYCGNLWLDQGRFAAIAASAFIVFSATLNDSFLYLSPHSLYAVIATGTLFVTARALQTGSQSYWLGAVAALAVAVATLEYALFLAATLVCCALVATFRGVYSLTQLWRVALRAGVVFVSVLALLWPGGLLRLTLLRNYMFFGYLTLRRPETYGNVGALTAWWFRVRNSPVEWCLVLGAVIILGVLLVDERRGPSGRSRWCLHALWMTPFVIYCALFLMTTSLNRSPQPRFLSSLIAALAVIVGASIGMLATRARRITSIVALGIVIAILGSSFFRLSSAQQAANDIVYETDDLLVAHLRAKLPAAGILAPQAYLPMLNWYFPDATVRGYEHLAQVPGRMEHWKPDVAICSSQDSDAFHGFLEGGSFGYRGETIASRYTSRGLTIFERISRAN